MYFYLLLKFLSLNVWEKEVESFGNQTDVFCPLSSVVIGKLQPTVHLEQLS